MGNPVLELKITGLIMKTTQSGRVQKINTFKEIQDLTDQIALALYHKGNAKIFCYILEDT